MEQPAKLPVPRALLGVPRQVRNKDIMLRKLEGRSNEAIAELYDLDPTTIKNILSSPLVAEEMLHLQGQRALDIVTQLKARSSEALETVTDTMRGDINSELRFKASSKILDLNPDLHPKDSGMKDFGEGLGESIIRELARRKREGETNELQPERDERKVEGTYIEGSGTGSSENEVCLAGGTPAVEGTILEGD